MADKKWAAAEEARRVAFEEAIGVALQHAEEEGQYEGAAGIVIAERIAALMGKGPHAELVARRIAETWARMRREGV